VVGPAGCGIPVISAINTLDESLQGFIASVQRTPDSLTRPATDNEKLRLHALWTEFFALLQPMLRSAVGEDVRLVSPSNAGVCETS
jgi:hypothetical protein